MKMPTMQRVKYPKTISWPLEPIQQNESTTEGNIIIHEDIEERQLHHDSNEPLWSTVLKPYYGDLKTVRQILAVQSCRHNAERPYDTRRWIIPGLGLWHLRLNMLRLIHKIHWGGVRPKDSSTLQYAADHWRRSNVNTGADFAKLEALLIHSYQARVSALITRAAVKRRWMTGKSTKIITKWLNRCSAKCYVQVIDEVVDLVHSLASTAHEDPWIEDEVMENHLRFMRHMEVYLLLRHSIKYGDIGMLRQALRDACVMFQAPEGSTNLYAAELIRLIHLYCSDAADVELQEAMLINSLVNLQGRDGKCFEADRLLEYLNGILKEGLGARRNSTKSPEDLMAEIALTVPYMLQLRLKVHQFTHRYYRGNHPEKSVAEDLQIMALDIIERDMLMLNQERFSAYFAVDLLRSGAKSLGANVDKYNEKIRMGGDWDAAVPDLTSDLPERPGSPTTQLLNDIGEN